MRLKIKYKCPDGADVGDLIPPAAWASAQTSQIDLETEKHDQFLSSRTEVKILSVWKISGEFQKLRRPL